MVGRACTTSPCTDGRIVMTPGSGLGSSPTSSSPRTQLMNDVRLTDVAPVATPTPAALGVQDGEVVIGTLSAKLVLVTGAATLKLPRYADSRVPGVPLIVMVCPAVNGFVAAVVTVTVSLGDGVVPEHEAECVRLATAADADGSAEIP